MPGSGINGIDFGFRRGSSTALYHTSIKNGTFNLCTDTGDLYIDIDNRRIAVKDIICMDREADILALENPYTRIYYAGDTYNLWRYDTNLHAWKQVSGELVRKAIKAERDNNNNIITEYYQTKSAASSDYSALSGRIGAIESTIGQLGGFNIVVVEDIEHLPAVGTSSTLYFVPNNSGSQTDLYDEYIWLPTENYYEKIGVSTADLSNYYTKTQIDSKLSSYSVSSQTYTKSEVDTALSNKAASTHSHDVFSYASTVSNGTKGFVPAPNSGQYDYVLTAHGWAANAASATYATNAGTAVRANNAASATNATNDGNGSNIAQTYVNNASTGDHSIVFSKGDGSTFSVEVAGGTDLSDDIISVDNTESETHDVNLKIKDSESNIDNLPERDTYATKFICEFTHPEYTSYLELNTIGSDLVHAREVSLDNTEIDKVEIRFPISKEDFKGLYNKYCKYNGKSYKFFYYYKSSESSTYEVWSNKALVVDKSYDGNSPLYYIDGGLWELNDINDYPNLSDDVIVEYINGEENTYSIDFPNTIEGSDCITNMITFDGSGNNLETMRGFLYDLEGMYEPNYEKSFGLFVNFIDGYVGFKYLYFPCWYDEFGYFINQNKHIKGTLAPLVEGEPATFEFYTSEIENNEFYECYTANFNKSKLLINSNLLGTKYPAASDYYDYIKDNTYDPSYEYYIENIYVEFSKNGIMYSTDYKEITKNDIINTLGYTPADGKLLGKKLKYVGITNGDGNEPVKYPLIKIDYDQYITNMLAKIYPTISNYDSDIIYSLRRDGMIGGNFGTIYLYSNTNLLINCPYNNKNYKYYYCAKSNYYGNWTNEIYSNKVIVAIKEYDSEFGSDRQYIYYLEPSTSSSGDQLIKLSLTSDDTDFCVAYDGTVSTSGYVILTNNYNEGYYVRNYEYFDTVADGLSYASYFYDHSFIIQDINQRNTGLLYSACYIDIINKELYTMDFMKSYNGREFNTGYVTMNQYIYWYQSNSSNDPNHPLYNASATPVEGKPIFYTRPFGKPYKIDISNYKNIITASDEERAITVGQDVFDSNYYEAYYYQKSALLFEYCSGSYLPGEEATLIKTEIKNNDTSNKQTYISNASTATGSIVFTKGDGSTFSISVPSGGPNAEILDARIGVNGTTYADLGTAIRSQINDLKAYVDSLVLATINGSY